MPYFIIKSNFKWSGIIDIVPIVMFRDTYCWGMERSDQLTNYCYQIVPLNKGHKKYCGLWPTLLLPAWLTFGKLSCKFENIGGRDAPRPPLAHLCVSIVQ